MNYKNKYLKYKLKYLTAKKLYGGMFDSDDDDKKLPPSFKSSLEKKEHKRTQEDIKKNRNNFSYRNSSN